MEAPGGSSWREALRSWAKRLPAPAIRPGPLRSGAQGPKRRDALRFPATMLMQEELEEDGDFERHHHAEHPLHQRHVGLQ